MADQGVLNAHKRARTEVDGMLLRYNTTKEFLTIRHLELLDGILDSQDVREAETRCDAVIKKIHTSLLAAWANKRIPGVITPESVTKQAIGAESLARSLEKKSELRGTEPDEIAKLLARARKQRARSEYLHLKAQCLRNNQPIPPPPTPDVEEEPQTEEVVEVVKKPRKPRRPKIRPRARRKRG